jgi:hypothetical protein
VPDARACSTHDATDLAQGCCTHGAHFVDDDDVQTVLDALTRLEPRHWQNYKKGHSKGVLETEDGATKTRVVKGACIFHNQPDFPVARLRPAHRRARGRRAVHRLEARRLLAASAAPRAPHRRQRLRHVDAARVEAPRLGRGGDDFHWWCTESDDAFIGGVPTYQYLREEIIEMVGQSAYDEMVIQIERPKWTPLPHPAVKSRR